MIKLKVNENQLDKMKSGRKTVFFLENTFKMEKEYRSTIKIKKVFDKIRAGACIIPVVCDKFLDKNEIEGYIHITSFSPLILCPELSEMFIEIAEGYMAHLTSDGMTRVISDLYVSYHEAFNDKFAETRLFTFCKFVYHYNPNPNFLKKSLITAFEPEILITPII